MSPLTPTGRVILGMIAFGKQTGYDIKQIVDKSTRHFWAASYGQIYPELRRLEEQGLIKGQADPRGGRARTVYELTSAGHAAVEDWLEQSPNPMFELRDEGMLKLFFSDVGSRDRRTAQLRAMRETHLRTLAQLEALGAQASDPPTGPRLTLDLGIGLHKWIVQWCEDAEQRLAAQAEEPADAD